MRLGCILTAHGRQLTKRTPHKETLGQGPVSADASEVQAGATALLFLSVAVLSTL